MDTLNYVRQSTTFFDKLLKEALTNGNVIHEQFNTLVKILDTAKKAVKFISPEDGKIFDDNLKGLPDELNLPYPVTVIEFQRKPLEEELEYKITGKGDIVTKVIVIATQLEKNVIDVKCLAYSQNMMEWILLPFSVKLSSEKYDETIHKKVDFKKHFITPNNYVLFTEYKTIAKVFLFDSNDGRTLDDTMVQQLHYPVHAILELIEALTCSNISQTTLKNNKPVKKGAHPFDEYKVLIIKSGNVTDGKFKESAITSTSPREHLRRGHTRTYATGLKIWIQSMTVNAGIGGRILKEYSVENTILKSASKLIH